MSRKNYFTFALTIVFLLIGSVAVFAQTGAPVGGQVLLKDADGKTTPVVGALVEVYRVDIKAKFPSDKTDKKGYFRFAGLPFGATFALSISGPGISPHIEPDVKAGNDAIVINVSTGNGKAWTEAEVRTALANRTVAGSSTGTKESVDEKKEREEFERKKAEVEAKNKKVEEVNRIVTESLQAGSKAYDAKDYTTAITKFDEGYQADPNFLGSAPVLLNNKALALINRGTETYNKSVKADDATKAAARTSAKQDFDDAVTSSERVIELLKNATSTDPNEQKGYDSNRLFALSNRKNAYRLMSQTGVNRERGKEALVAFQEYIAVETDPAKKSKAQMDLALTLQDSNEFEQAIAEFEKILTEDPNNADALVGIGLSMVNVGYINLDVDAAKGKEQLQQAANFLQKFVDIAPDTHKFKKDAIETIAQLKEQQKVTPQKTTTKTTTTKKKN